MKLFLRQFSLLILAECIIVAGIATGMFSLIKTLNHREYLVLNAKTIVHLQQGPYQIFYDYGEAGAAAGPMEGLSKSIVAMVDDGQRSLNVQANDSTTFQLNRQKSKSVYRFVVPEEGKYGITLISNVPELEAHVRFAVMRDLALWTVIRRMWIFFVAAAPFLTSGLVVYARMEKKKLVKTI
ncbi:hypothetical protein [Cohnella sp. 56]|uniref:hypothetical protein n=1 Tax=Cohnella sp. 56 TaxID=3113722 RepID=UPI0030EA0B77